MVIIRKSLMCKLSCVLAVVAMVAVDVAPVQAQQYAGTRNSRQNSIGDIDSNKLNAKVRSVPGLRFGPGALFVDSEIYGQFSAPRPFIYSLPQYSSAGLSFDGVTYPEYLNLVANSYGLSDTDLYKNLFLFGNSFSVNNQANFYEQYDDLVDIQQFFINDFAAFGDAFELTIEEQVRYLTDPSALPSDLNDAAFDRAHQQDFLTGGGFFPLSGGPVTAGKDPEFTPLPTNDPVGDTSAATLLEGADILNQASASQEAPESAPVVSAVPEPATLGLLVAGATALIGRRRR